MKKIEDFNCGAKKTTKKKKVEKKIEHVRKVKNAEKAEVSDRMDVDSRNERNAKNDLLRKRKKKSVEQEAVEEKSSKISLLSSDSSESEGEAGEGTNALKKRRLIDKSLKNNIKKKAKKCLLEEEICEDDSAKETEEKESYNEEDEEEDEDEDEDEDDVLGITHSNIEEKSRKLEKQAEKQRKEELEILDNVGEKYDSSSSLVDFSSMKFSTLVNGENFDKIGDLDTVRDRMYELVEILSNWKEYKINFIKAYYPNAIKKDNKKVKGVEEEEEEKQEEGEEEEEEKQEEGEEEEEEKEEGEEEEEKEEEGEEEEEEKQEGGKEEEEEEKYKINSLNQLDRKKHLDELAACISVYFQTSMEIASYFLSIFNCKDAVQFFEANEKARPVTLRTNTLKARRRELSEALIRRGCFIENFGDWSNVGLKVIQNKNENSKRNSSGLHSGNIPIGATPEYLCGHYMIQSAASFIPVISLAPQLNERVLDMSAAPGGKTTYISQLMKNTGVVFANELNKDRCAALMANIHRLGVTNCIVINCDGRKLHEILPQVDRVLLDAPCTGLGVMSRDPSVKVKRGMTDIINLSRLQKELINCAFDLIDARSKTGGYLVYSTCSVSVEENEEVVDHLLKVRHAKLMPLGIEIGVNAMSGYKSKKFHSSIPAMCRRVYPHVNNLDGFFIAKIKKVSDGKKERAKKDRHKHNEFVKVWGDEELKNKSLMEEFLHFEDADQNAAKESASAERTNPGKPPRSSNLPKTKKKKQKQKQKQKQKEKEKQNQLNKQRRKNPLKRKLLQKKNRSQAKPSKKTHNNTIHKLQKHSNNNLNPKHPQSAKQIPKTKRSTKFFTKSKNNAFAKKL